MSPKQNVLLNATKGHQIAFKERIVYRGKKKKNEMK